LPLAVMAGVMAKARICTITMKSSMTRTGTLSFGLSDI
jgi:hypothetical protein